MKNRYFERKPLWYRGERILPTAYVQNCGQIRFRYLTGAMKGGMTTMSPKAYLKALDNQEEHKNWKENNPAPELTGEYLM